MRWGCQRSRVVLDMCFVLLSRNRSFATPKSMPPQLLPYSALPNNARDGQVWVLLPSCSLKNFLTAKVKESTFSETEERKALPLPVVSFLEKNFALKKKLSKKIKMGCRCVTIREEFATRMSSPSKIRSAGRSSSSGRTPKVIAFGNVLLDSTVQLNDLEILNRHKLSFDTKGEIDIRTLTKISEEIRDSLMAPVNCGGSALNTTRILKQLGTDCLFFGAVGGDPLADLLKGILKKTGVHASLEVIPDDKTGQCVCFVYGRKNALYANIGASSKFSLEYLQHVESQEILTRKYKKRQIFYIEGFFLPQRTDVIRHIVRNYISARKILVLNLSAPYIIEENFDIMTFLVHSAQIVFGNREEFTTLSRKCGFRTLEDFSKQELTQKPTTVFVITNDKQNVLLIRNNGTREEPMVLFDSFAVPMVRVVDSTGAGDSFVAGFLHSYLKGCPLTKCIQHAITVASLVVQQVGCNLP